MVATVAFYQGKGDRKSLQLTAEAKVLFARKSPLVVEVLEEQSPLYQQDNLIYIGFRECCKDDKRIEHLLVGLFSQNSINELASNVPPLRDKLLSALERQYVQYESYDYRKVVEIFNTFPKVEMFFLEDKGARQSCKDLCQPAKTSVRQVGGDAQPQFARPHSPCHHAP